VALGELDITELVPKANVVEVDRIKYVCIYDVDGQVAWIPARLVEYRPRFPEMTLR
jgi:hypothetical protein